MSSDASSILKVACHVVLSGAAFTAASLPTAGQDDEWSYYARGALKRYVTGDYAAVGAWCERAGEFGVRDPAMTAVHIDAEMAQGKYAEAANLAAEAAAVFGEYAPMQIKVIEALRAGGREEDARKALASLNDLAKELNPKALKAGELVALGKAALLLGGEAKMVLAEFFQKARKLDPGNLDGHLAAAELAIDKADFALAAQILKEARSEVGPLPRILHLSAVAYSPSDREQSGALLEEALEINPNHVPSLILRAEHAIDAEHYGLARETLEKARGVNPNHPGAWAFEAAIALITDDPKAAESARAKALAPRPKNPEVDFIIGEKLSQVRRFAEGSSHLRRALEADPDHLRAKRALGQNLLRLGKEEGWKLIAEVQEKDKYDVETYNLMLLHDHLQDFETIESGRLVVRMTPHEAAVYGVRVVDLLEDAIETLGGKYGYRPEGRVVVDFFPNQQDFAIRTLGFPGGLGILGACFGNVIVMNSPGSAGAMGSNWESTLWHEFCHTVTLGATGSRIPRWLTEGISVHEERQRDSSCGHKMTPEFRRRILREEGDGLIPISELSGALTAFNDPGTIDFAYYQASLIVEYMLEEFGASRLQGVLSDLRENADVEKALKRRMAPTEDLDAGFGRFARGLAAKVAPDADWEVPGPESPLHRDPGGVARYLEENPDNIWALSTHCRFMVAEQAWPEAKAAAERLLQLYPEFTGPGNGYEILALASRNLDEPEREREALREWTRRDSDATGALERLIEIDLERGDWPAVEEDARRLLAVNPLLRSPHRALGLAAQEQGKAPDAIGAFETLLHLDPVNPADAHFRLAQLYREQDDVRARRHVLCALEEAPRFRGAHRLLLALESGSPVPAEPEPSKP